MQDIDIEPPQRGGDGYTSLRDIALSIHKGKARVGNPVPDLSGPATRKRLHEGDAELAASSPGDFPTAWLYGTASAAVASFLHGAALPPDNSGEEPRRPAVNRRRLNSDGNASSIFTPLPVDESPPLRRDNSPLGLVADSTNGTETSVASSTVNSTSPTGFSTVATSPASSRSPHSDLAVSAAQPGSPFAWTESFDTAPSSRDPFAYIDNAEPPIFGVSPPTPLASTATAWGADAALLAHPLFAGDVPSHLTRPVPPYTHAYVSFGAGARQKHVDLFTAAHPMGDGAVPYHIPLYVWLL